MPGQLAHHAAHRRHARPGLCLHRGLGSCILQSWAPGAAYPSPLTTLAAHGMPRLNGASHIMRGGHCWCLLGPPHALPVAAPLPTPPCEHSPTLPYFLRTQHASTRTCPGAPLTLLRFSHIPRTRSTPPSLCQTPRRAPPTRGGSGGSRSPGMQTATPPTSTPLPSPPGQEPTLLGLGWARAPLSTLQVGVLFL